MFTRVHTKSGSMYVLEHPGTLQPGTQVAITRLSEIPVVHGRHDVPMTDQFVEAQAVMTDPVILGKPMRLRIDGFGPLVTTPVSVIGDAMAWARL